MEDEGNTGSSTYNITKLNETNYRSWSQQLRWILDERDLWELVNGEEVRPTVSTTQPQQSEQSSTATGDINKLTAWTKKAKKARSIIGSSITASVMTYIEGIDNPVDMWTTLAEIYNPKTQTTLLQTVREFMTVKREDGDMEKHLQRVKRLKRQVEEQGEKVSDTVYNGILLNSVPEDYNIAVNILESQDRLTPEMIINRLMEASRKHGGEEVSGNGKTKTAMLTNSGQSKGKKSSSSSSPSTKVVVCGHCKQKGHKDTKCWIKHPELRPKKSGSTEKKDEQHFVMSAHVKKTEKAAGEKQSKSDPSKWYIDSAASEHFSPYKHLFESYQELSNPHEITTAEGNTVKGIGKGSITIQAMAGSDIISLTFKDVTYAPDMDANLLSTTTLYNLGFEVSSKPGLGVRILKDDILIADTVREGKLFRLKTVQHQAQSATTTVGESMAVWHRRLAHLGEQNIIKLTRMAEGIQLSKDSILGICGSCQKGKQTRKPSHEPSSRSTERGDLIHCDLCGPITPTTLGGNNYVISFTDDATRMSTIAPLKGKSSAEILCAFKHYRTFLKTQNGIKIKRLRTDGGSEFKEHLSEYLKSNGIKHETTASYSPDQNSVAERLNRTVIE